LHQRNHPCRIGRVLQLFVTMSKNKKPKYKVIPSANKIPNIIEDVNALENEYFKWFATPKYVDYDEQEWGWNNVTIDRFFNKCLQRLQHYETLTWAQIKAQDHCHPVPIGEIAPKASKRIIDKYGPMDDLYQVKAEGKCRLFGRKDRQNFYLIWHDKYHTVYPMGK